MSDLQEYVRARAEQRRLEFYNESHVQSGPLGGQFTEGSDGPGRQGVAGSQDLGKPGTEASIADIAKEIQAQREKDGKKPLAESSLRVYASKEAKKRRDSKESMKAKVEETVKSAPAAPKAVPIPADANFDPNTGKPIVKIPVPADANFDPNTGKPIVRNAPPPPPPPPPPGAPAAKKGFFDRLVDKVADKVQPHTQHEDESPEEFRHRMEENARREAAALDAKARRDAAEQVRKEQARLAPPAPASVSAPSSDAGVRARERERLIKNAQKTYPNASKRDIIKAVDDAIKGQILVEGSADAVAGKTNSMVRERARTQQAAQEAADNQRKIAEKQAKAKKLGILESAAAGFEIGLIKSLRPGANVGARGSKKMFYKDKNGHLHENFGG